MNVFLCRLVGHLTPRFAPTPPVDEVSVIYRVTVVRPDGDLRFVLHPDMGCEGANRVHAGLRGLVEELIAAEGMAGRLQARVDSQAAHVDTLLAAKDADEARIKTLRAEVDRLEVERDALTLTPYERFTKLFRSRD